MKIETAATTKYVKSARVKTEFCTYTSLYEAVHKSLENSLRSHGTLFKVDSVLIKIKEADI